MFIKTLFEDRFVLTANPPLDSDWRKQWNRLPTDRPMSVSELLDIPSILPEPDASRRQQFDEWVFPCNQKDT